MVTSSTALDDEIEQRTQEIGRDVWNRLERRRPTVFESRWWLDHVLEWAMADQAVKVQMFRFVDALPMLRSSESVTQHLQEYFEDVRLKLPLAARLGLDIAEHDSLLGKALAFSARTNARKMAERFIAGSRVEEILQAVTKLRKKGLAFTLDLLGEAVISEPEAEAYQRAYLDLIAGLAPQVAKWSEHPVIDRDIRTWAPRCNVSLKLSALDSQFKPLDARGTSERVKARLRPILRAAIEHDAHVHIDMEHYHYKNLTLRIFKEVLLEEEFRRMDHVGIVIQAYLLDSGQDLQMLRQWAEERGTPVWVRLVKGAYWDYETVAARYRGWPTPVYLEKWQTDANFEQQTRYLFRNHEWLRPAIASHNLRSLAHAMAAAVAEELPEEAWEIQMLYGMAEDQALLFAEEGQRVRVYTPFGEMLPGMAYLVRRLLENTSNDSFLRHAYDRDVKIEDLLRSPSPPRSTLP